MVEKWGDKNFLADFFDILLEKKDKYSEKK